jgi:hypothetical protein
MRRTPIVVLQAAGKTLVHRRADQVLNAAENSTRQRIDVVAFDASVNVRRTAPDAMTVSGEHEAKMDTK